VSEEDDADRAPTEAVVTEGLDGVRLDRALAELFPEHSRAALQRHIEDGAVTLNDGPPRRGAKTLVRTGDRITHRPPPPRQWDVAPEPMSLRILFEDPDVLVLDKAVDVVVHPAAGHWSGTLVQGVLHHVGHGLPGAEDRPGVVHRLDRDTTGVIVFAKNERAHAHLAGQFSDRTAEKQYLAVVLGRVSRSPLTLDTWYGRDPKDRKKFSSRVSTGKRAVSRIRVGGRMEESTWVEVDLQTGRTHQIRVHLADVGHPLLGDRTYGGRRLARSVRAHPRLEFERPALHAQSLTVDLPAGGRRRFVAPIPADLRALVERLGGALPEERRG
jgi:23S rRNA pseudouridine1911/1915/1917 synthase